MNDLLHGDPLTRPFWQAASRGELLIQRCADCAAHQFYPRAFCLACGSLRVEWRPVAGSATVYSLTTVRIELSADLPPPYVVALVDLDVGPRLLTWIEGEGIRIGDRVHVAWRARADAPPLAVFRSIAAQPRAEVRDGPA